MKKIYLLSIVWLISQNGFCQNVTADSITNVITKELPFDVVFPLIVKHKPNDVITYMTITKKRSGKISSFTKLDVKRAQNLYGENNVSRPINKKAEIIISLTKKVDYQDIKGGSSINVFPLAPSTGYEFEVKFVNYSYSVKKREDLVQAKEFDVSNEMKALLIANNLKIITDAIHAKETSKALAYGIAYDSINRIDSIEVNIKREIGLLLEKELKDAKINIAFEPFLNCYQNRIGSLSYCDSCSVSDQQLIRNLKKYRFYSLNDASFFKDVAQGYVKITDSNLDKRIGKTDYQSRLANLKSTYAFIEEFLNYPKLSNSTCSSLTILGDIELQINRLSSTLKGWQNLIRELSSSVCSGVYENKKYVGYSGGSTTLASKGKFRVRPDFGVAFASNGSFSRIMPAIGVRLNFRALDPDLPYRQIVKKGFAHRSSLGISFTTNSISDGSTRFDLFGKNNLIVDYGIRLNNAFSVSIGTLVFKRADPNPFSSDQKLAFLPTIGLSIDFEIIDAIKHIKDVFTGK
jgi:hypothetical protein